MGMCPLCSVKEARTESHIIDMLDDARVVHLTCRRCHQSIVVVMRTNEMGVQCVGIVTDLGVEDAKALLRDRQVDIDDVLDVHEQLNSQMFLAAVRRESAEATSATRGVGSGR